MRTAIAAALLASATFISACDDSAPTQPNRPIVVRSQAQDKLHQLDEMNLKITLRRAIYDSGSSCRTVTKAGYVQEHENLSMWTASCADRRNWALFVGLDGNVQVRPCRDMQQLGLPACVIRNEEPGGAPG